MVPLKIQKCTTCAARKASIDNPNPMPRKKNARKTKLFLRTRKCLMSNMWHKNGFPNETVNTGYGKP